MKNSGSIIAAFLGGAVIGGLVGAYLMSENGKEFRKKITDLLESSGTSKVEEQEKTTETTPNPESGLS